MLYLATTNASTLGFGRCPDIPVKDNFDLERFLGTWYEIAANPSHFEPPDIEHGRCQRTAYYHPDDDTDDLLMLNYDADPLTDTQADMWTPNATEPAKFKIQFNGCTYIKLSS